MACYLYTNLEIHINDLLQKTELIFFEAQRPFVPTNFEWDAFGIVFDRLSHF